MLLPGHDHKSENWKIGGKVSHDHVELVQYQMTVSGSAKTHGPQQSSHNSSINFILVTQYASTRTCGTCDMVWYRLITAVTDHV